MASYPFDGPVGLVAIRLATLAMGAFALILLFLFLFGIF